uniref:Olfactory receptor n=1 Tax=Xenopus tropicalis TaxID=8364 RepID=A0A803K349_XENTR
MYESNYTRVAEVWITGLQNSETARIPLFIFLLTIYLTVLMGNSLVILLVLSRSHLQSPMYIFLSGLSFSEIIFTSDLMPTLLGALLQGGTAIYFISCLAQFYLCASLGVTECLLLAVMSFDRYMAICDPLHYQLVMSSQLCLLLIIFSWAGGFMIVLIALIMICQLDFCGPRVVDHFFCDFAPLLELSCSNSSAVKTYISLCVVAAIIFPLAFVMGTYVCIIHVIFRIPSSAGRKKAFSTCSSHLSVVYTYYGTLIILYVIPHHAVSSTSNKILSLMYTVVTPLFNPIIYSLRNQEIKEVLKHLLPGISKSKK